MGVIGLDHVQLVMPRGKEEVARAFYAGVLGLSEVPKPEADRGGCWFEGGAAHIHLGVEDGFAPSRKAHPALLVEDLDDFALRLETAGVAFTPGRPLAGYKRGDIVDPFGNRLELIERLG
jgi:catechol 2,3-dioxygenase-like lactoylglutathione lyase family enzyme